jgi:hypothetical protein
VESWNEFYNRARALRAHFSENRQAKLEEIFKKIEKVERYNFPKTVDPALDAACEALNTTLENASKANVKHDTTEIKEALKSLQRAYDKAAKSNTVLIRCIDVVPPCAPYSPLDDEYLKGVVLARPWARELVTKIHDQSLESRILVIGNPGSGGSLGLSCL